MNSLPLPDYAAVFFHVFMIIQWLFALPQMFLPSFVSLELLHICIFSKLIKDIPPPQKPHKTHAQNLGCVPCLYAPLCLFLSHHSVLHIRLMSLHPKCKPIENRKYIICYCYVYIFSAHKGQSIKCPFSKNVSPLDYKDLKRIYHVLSIFAYLLNELERINNLASSFTNHGNSSSPINSFL